jgi:hypothetical protein
MKGANHHGDVGWCWIELDIVNYYRLKWFFTLKDGATIRVFF